MSDRVLLKRNQLGNCHNCIDGTRKPDIVGVLLCSICVTKYNSRIANFIENL